MKSTKQCPCCRLSFLDNGNNNKKTHDTPGTVEIEVEQPEAMDGGNEKRYLSEDENLEESGLTILDRS